jgi:NAD(P)-dependent dehydrogenase (short-subunit alcohol dehydrogenase family)
MGAADGCKSQAGAARRLSMQDVRGLNAVVTGGADGIGRAIALEAARAGMNVAIIDIRLAAAEDVAAACSIEGVRAVAIRCDVSIAADIKTAADKVRAEFGGLNLLWINAGLGIPYGLINAPRAALRWLYGVNVEGLIDTARAFVPAIQANTGWRHVGITGSMAGLVQMPDAGPTAYAASKFAAVGIAEALRAELMPAGIGVTLFCPGTVNTRIWDGGRARPARFGGPVHAPEAAGERWRQVGMDVDAVARCAFAAARNGRFYVVLPESAARAARLNERHAAIEAAIESPGRWRRDPAGRAP